jgi:beta-galactosidase
VTTSDSSAVVHLSVPEPRLWSAEQPDLYDCIVTLSTDGHIHGEHHMKVGLRTIEIDGRSGLRVNGRPELLRGANVHHDSGVLGAATFRAAEFRRVRILKENGFNAIRSAHNPAARDLLDACDALGMYVMDELYDGWYNHKTDHDDAPHFATTWRSEADAMVAKDRNGNGSPDGRARSPVLDELFGSARLLTKELGQQLIDTRQLPTVPLL